MGDSLTGSVAGDSAGCGPTFDNDPLITKRHLLLDGGFDDIGANAIMAFGCPFADRQFLFDDRDYLIALVSSVRVVWAVLELKPAVPTVDPVVPNPAPSSMWTGLNASITSAARSCSASLRTITESAVPPSRKLVSYQIRSCSGTCCRQIASPRSSRAAHGIDCARSPIQPRRLPHRLNLT